MTDQDKWDEWQQKLHELSQLEKSMADDSPEESLMELLTRPTLDALAVLSDQAEEFVQLREAYQKLKEFPDERVTGIKTDDFPGIMGLTHSIVTAITIQNEAASCLHSSMHDLFVKLADLIADKTDNV